MWIGGFDDKKLKEYKKNMYDEKRRRSEIKGERREEKIQIATAMLADGVNADLVCKYTGLTLEEVKALQQQ